MDVMLMRKFLKKEALKKTGLWLNQIEVVEVLIG